MCDHPELPPSPLKQGKQNRAVNGCCLIHSKLVTRKETFVSAFWSLRKVPASAWNLFGAVPKPVSLSAKRTYDSETSVVTVLTGSYKRAQARR